MTGGSGNGRGPGGPADPSEVDDVDDAPLDEAEALAGSEAASEEADETLDERVGTVCEDLDGVSRSREGDVEHLAVAGRVFAVVGADLLEVALDPSVARAALATPDTRPSPRGAGWVAFTPKRIDRFALDRAEAWVRFAYGRASAPRPGA